MNKQKIHHQLQTYLEHENFSGYDPYDTLNSYIPFRKLGKWTPVLAIQFQKLNPVNIRPILGIKKERNPKAIGLLLHAYSLLYKRFNNKQYLQTATELFDWLQQHYSKGFSGHCWGYNFPWASSEKYLPKYAPTSVVTGFICRGIYAYYLVTKNETAAHLLQSAAQFIQNDIHQYSDETGICLSYTTLAPDVCYNASLLAAEVLLYDQLVNKTNHTKILEQAASFVLKRQLPSGAWNYSMNLKTGIERKQIDFHQGYVIDSLWQINLLLENYQIKEAIQKGLQYYYQNQFLDSGQAIYRLPKKYPVEIHNQAQGIITASKLKKDFPEYIDNLNQIINFTIENMLSPKGYFYYRLFKRYKIKIPYMRWSQAWMFLALTQCFMDE